MIFVANTRLGALRRVVSENYRYVVLLVCPGCGDLAELADDQWHGRVSVDHGCPGGYHETHDFAAAVQAAGGFRAV